MSLAHRYAAAGAAWPSAVWVAFYLVDSGTAWCEPHVRDRRTEIQVLTRWGSALLILALPASVLASSLVTDYWPNGPVHPPSLTWGAIGTWLWINPQAVTATLPEAERTNRCDVPEGVARGG